MSTLGFLRMASATGIALICASVATSCLTPKFAFEDGSSSTHHCENRVEDADETDRDCGGIDCNVCALGRSCETNGDCINESCTSGKCQDPSCTDDVKNGTETDVDCGGKACGPCGVDEKCEEAGDCASQVCQSGKCKAATCTDRKLNQNEVDIDCGGDCPACDVGQACVVKADCLAPPLDIEPDAGATATCASRTCDLTCNEANRGDCNAAAADGCEALLDTDVAHCGACGNTCALDHATPKCVDGDCAIESCADNYVNCDSNEANGCETNKTSSVDHCGSCNNRCGGTAQTGVASASCSSAGGGTCLVSCDNDMCPDTSDPERKCTAAKGTKLNCSACGDVCSGTSPFCTLGTCTHRPIAVKNDATVGSKSLPGALSITHALSAGSGTHRMVVLGVAATLGKIDTLVVKYSGVAMTEAVSNLLGEAGQTAIFYILDADLPGTAGSYSIQISSTASWGSVIANVVELSDVDQTPPITSTSVASMDGCDPLSAVAEVEYQDSFVFAAAYSWGDEASGGTPSGLTKETLNAFVPAQNHGLFGYVSPASSTVGVGWDALTGCWGTRLATVTFSSIVD